MRRLLLLGVCALLLTATPAPPAAGDVLVRVDGERVETEGTWEIKGRLVVFTTADGQLASMRASEVDLEASRAATAEDAAPKQEAKAPAVETEPRRSSGRRITNADIKPGRPPIVLPVEPDAEAAAEGAPEVGRGEVRRELATLDIERDTSPVGHAVIRGTLRNTAAETAVGVSLTIHLHGRDGEPVGTAEAEVAAGALVAGEETTFVADFPDVFSYQSMRLVPRATFLETAASEGESSPEEGEVQPER